MSSPVLLLPAPPARLKGPDDMPADAGDRLTTLETLLSTYIQQNKEAFLRLDNVHGDHETRIRSLERQVWMAGGAATVLGGLIGILTQLLTSQ